MISHTEESIGMNPEQKKVIEIPEMRNRVRVFRDRNEAGRIIAGLLKPYCPGKCIAFAIPSGGVPLGIEIAAALNIPLEIAVVSKITLPWNTEAGYGAVAFNGTVKLNESLISRLRLSEYEVKHGIQLTREKVQRRVRQYSGARPFPDVSGKTAILADDGIASGFTFLTGLEALKTMRPAGIFAASPTGSDDSLQKVSAESDLVFCPNIRTGWTFAVADAYREWSDIEEAEALRMFAEFQKNRAGKI